MRLCAIQCSCGVQRVQPDAGSLRALLRCTVYICCSTLGMFMSEHIAPFWVVMASGVELRP